MSAHAPPCSAQNGPLGRGSPGSDVAPGPDSAQGLLRSLEALAGPYTPFDPSDAADTPEQQFLRWLGAAVAAGVTEPHAMTLSTVDEDGLPDARVLLLKDLSAAGWCFATSRTSEKGRQLASQPQAALTFYWPLLGRQVRVRGAVVDLGPEAGRADFLARGRGSRAVALLERQSRVLDADETFGRALAGAEAHLDAHPDATAASWTVYLLRPSAVEFWQGDAGRRHTRLQYVQAAEGWTRRRLWP